MTVRNACCIFFGNPGKLIEINDSSIINDRSFRNPNITLTIVDLSIFLITNNSYKINDIIAVKPVTVPPTYNALVYIAEAI